MPDALLTATPPHISRQNVISAATNGQQRYRFSRGSATVT